MSRPGITNREERALKHPDTGGRGVADTFPALLLHHARLRGEWTAIREKDLGIWQSWSWSQVAEEVGRSRAAWPPRVSSAG